jgi:hypothetical protein
MVVKDGFALPELVEHVDHMPVMYVQEVKRRCVELAKPVDHSSAHIGAVPDDILAVAA